MLLRGVLNNAMVGILLIILVSLTALIGCSIAFYKSFFKRFWDILISSMMIIILSPLFIILIILGIVFMKGNPFFLQKRPGKIRKNGKEKIFTLIKFRTMSDKKDINGALLSDSERLNRYGKFLRSTSLDELPELFNIFIGTMSFVGPRPQLVRDMVFMSEHQRKRHLIRPGLTGLAQINGRNNISWEQKIEFDLEYISNVNLLNDLTIFLKTIFKVLKKADVNREGTASDLDYGDWLLRNKQIDLEEYKYKQEMANKILQGEK